VERAREVYTKVIRAAIAYGASAYHKPAKTAGQAKGIAKKLAPEQSACLRSVLGAYKRTPVRSLETEANVPPLDLYLNKRLADFEARLETTGKGQLIRNASTLVATRLKSRRGRPRETRPDPDGGEARQQWSRRWVADRSTAEAMVRDWERRWQAVKAAERPQLGHGEPADTPDFTPKALRKHGTLRKHESSALIQIRTGKIGLRAFLFDCRVPGVVSPNCECGSRETAAHVILHCPLLAAKRNGLNRDLGRPLRTHSDLAAATAESKSAPSIARWTLWIGRHREFKLAEDLLRQQLMETT